MPELLKGALAVLFLEMVFLSIVLADRMAKKLD